MSLAVVFDVDGTLLDSYQKIVSVLQDVNEYYHLSDTFENIYSFVTKRSVKEYLEIIAKTHKDVHEIYKLKYQESNIRQELMPNTREMLKRLDDNGYMCIIYTHKNNEIYDILEEYGISHYFKDIITIENGFKRKPDPEAIIYLQDKYKLDKIYYVGDRIIDIDMAYNAKIDGILYKPSKSVVEPNGKELCVIEDLMDVCKIVESKDV